MKNDKAVSDFNLQVDELGPYLRSVAVYNDNMNTLSEELKLKLYGLSKQIKEGDCTIAMQPTRY